MWAQACELLERAERLQRQFFRLGTETASRHAWQPPTDIFETERELWILVALPGVPAADIELGIEGGALRVSGMRPLPQAMRQATVHRLEIPHGRFERRIELPPGRYELDRHEVQHGCLVLTLRKH